ncbi:MAG: cysteine desulfurase [Naasia sp.]|jgi:cysteine desulfurase|uniref:cysteine desulfurase family protein n=1 Tax=Naasia sp. TaxID=2546198 RepID=UPI0026271122|nr:cysteine desulfurase family protein [Naasia sp.]MCU1571101.1 cysteine desulfurase [Naasia sp.]
MAIYLDHAATTPLRPEVLEVYTRALSVTGNPSSIHGQGQSAKRVLEEAREQLAEALNCDPVEVVFTSGGTEAVNTAVKGIYWARTAGAVGGRRVLLPGGEHHATVDTVAWLEAHEGARIEELPIDHEARLAPESVGAALEDEDAALVTLLWANNEVGTVQDVVRIAAIAGESGVPVHADAVAALGYVPVDFRSSGLAAMSVSAHKVGGPVGVGALVLGRSATAQPLVHGGGQQRGIRSGTQDVAGAVAFAAAATLAVGGLDERATRLSGLRDRLIGGIRDAVPGAVLRGAPAGASRLPGNAHFTFPGCDGDSLLFLLDMAGISVSTGAACQAGVADVSHVLLAMGVPEQEARGALRVSLGEDTSGEDIEALLRVLPEAVARAQRAGHADRVPSALR